MGAQVRKKLALKVNIPDHHRFKGGSGLLGYCMWKVENTDNSVNPFLSIKKLTVVALRHVNPKKLTKIKRA